MASFGAVALDQITWPFGTKTLTTERMFMQAAGKRAQMVLLAAGRLDKFRILHGVSAICC